MKSGVFALSLLYLSLGASLSPEELCGDYLYQSSGPKIEQDFEGSWQEQQYRQACRFAGVYEESLLPDAQAFSSGRSTGAAVYDYEEFIKSLDKSIGQIEAGDRCETDSTALVSYPSVRLKDTASGEIPVSVVSPEEALELFNSFKKDSKYAFDVIEDGCWARAHLMTRALERKGIRAAKIFAEGDLQFRTSRAMNGEFVNWSYHVAPVVAVQTAKGIEMMVLDPAIYDRPESTKKWTADMVQSERSKESATIYMTDRFNLDPLRGATLAKIRNDSNAGRWHRAEIELAELELVKKQKESEDRPYLLEEYRLMSESTR